MPLLWRETHLRHGVCMSSGVLSSLSRGPMHAGPPRHEILSHHRCMQTDGVEDQPIRCTDSRIEHKDQSKDKVNEGCPTVPLARRDRVIVASEVHGSAVGEVEEDSILVRGRDCHHAASMPDF